MSAVRVAIKPLTMATVKGTIEDAHVKTLRRTLVDRSQSN